MNGPDPLVLTLALDAPSQAWLEALRRAHFPPARNLVPAHVTLFHALPGAELAAVAATLAAACARMAPAPVRLGPPRFLGHGVALEVAAPAVAALRARLAAGWAPWLTRQDAQPWRPHATLQNKVAAAAARSLYEQLSKALPVRDAQGEGLLLWHYQGGPWINAGEYKFRKP